ncbi:MAG TPA: VWA-like domain-containing protein [Vicinamibacterales bacterium]|nr:VWA-like domain-containing protein [Vicinamibacterales bacterium]
MLKDVVSLIRRSERKTDGYSRGLQAARVRASYQRAYFAPALFTLIPVKTDLIGSMAVDRHWRLYYNDSWVQTHTVEENAALLIHEVSHLLRDHADRKTAAAVKNDRLWNTATDCEINDDLAAEGLPLPDDPPQPGKYGLKTGESAEMYYRQMSKPAPPGREANGAAAGSAPSGSERDCGSGAHGERRPWELPDEDAGEAGVDALKARLVQREVAQRIQDTSGYAGEVPLGWRRWAHTVLTPKVDYMATIRHAVRRALRDSTLGRYDRTYRRPHRRQACYGEFLMPSFYQPRPRPGFLIDTSSSMQDTQLARAVAELGGLTRQLGSGAELVVACCDVVVHDVRKVFTSSQVELYGGGGTDIGAGLRWFIERKSAPIDLLVVVTDCHTPWPQEVPPFPVITIRVGDGAPPPWGDRGANQVITIEDPPAEPPPVRGRSGSLPWPAEAAELRRRQPDPGGRI